MLPEQEAHRRSCEVRDHRQYSRDRRGRPDAAINTVSGTLVNTIKGTGAVGAALTGTVSDVLRGAILGTAHAGLTFAMRPRGRHRGDPRHHGGGCRSHREHQCRRAISREERGRGRCRSRIGRAERC